MLEEAGTSVAERTVRKTSSFMDTTEDAIPKVNTLYARETGRSAKTGQLHYY